MLSKNLIAAPQFKSSYMKVQISIQTSVPHGPEHPRWVPSSQKHKFDTRLLFCSICVICTFTYKLPVLESLEPPWTCFQLKIPSLLMFPWRFLKLLLCCCSRTRGINILPIECAAAWNILQILRIVRRLEGTFRTENKHCRAFVCFWSPLETRLPPLQLCLRVTVAV